MTYRTNKPIPNLSDVRKMERSIEEVRFDNLCKELLKKAIEYYRINYPNSIITPIPLIWKETKIILGIGKGTLNEELEKLSERELSSIYEIFEYFHDERQMNKVEDHRKRNIIIGKVKKIIPGGHNIIKLKGLYKKLKNTQIKIDEILAETTKERESFEKRLEEKQLPDKNELTCPICNRVCGNKGGLTRHIKSHDKK